MTNWFHRAELEEVPIRGRFAVTEAAVVATERLLRTFRDPDADHEGIVFLLGFEFDAVTVYTTALAPDAEHGPGFVACGQAEVLAASRSARSLGLSVLAQVHSHPGAWARHSEGDDRMVLMPFEGMLSFVVPHYACGGLRPLSSIGVHQFQESRWRACSAKSIRDAICVLPDRVDLR